MHRTGVFSSLLAFSVWLVPMFVRASEPPLRPLPADKLVQMAPLLRHGDIALIESKPNGRMRQITVMTLVEAPPNVTRQVVATPEQWPQFVPGLTRAKVTHHPDGSLDYDFAIDLKLMTLSTNNRMSPQSDGSIEIHDNDPRDGTRQVWEFYAVPGSAPRGSGVSDGENTIMVMYGYTDVLHSTAWFERIVKAAPTLEHGIGLSAQLGYLHAMKARAEQLANRKSPGNITGSGPGFSFLLERGTVAFMRPAATGRLNEISVLDTFHAPLERIENTISHPSEYVRFMDGIKKSYELSRDGAQTRYETEFNVSLLSFTTQWLMHVAGNSLEGIAVSGDLKNARFRWDLTKKGEQETLVVYRASQDLTAASPLILGTLFRAMPIFEYGVAVALGLVSVVGVRARAEGLR